MKTNHQPGFDHEELFLEYCLSHGVAGAARNYVSCMHRMARVLRRRLGPVDIRSEADVQALSAQLSAPDLNDRHRSNFRSVLRKYIQMLRSNFKGQFDAFVVSAIDVDPNTLPARVRQEVSRIVRDTAMARALKRTYAGQCQICAKRLELSPGEFYVEAHHLQPLGEPHNGPDAQENILCVCPNCHVLLDFGALPIGPKTLRIRLHAIGRHFLDYHNDRCE